MLNFRGSENQIPISLEYVFKGIRDANPIRTPSGLQRCMGKNCAALNIGISLYSTHAKALSIAEYSRILSVLPYPPYGKRIHQNRSVVPLSLLAEWLLLRSPHNKVWGFEKIVDLGCTRFGQAVAGGIKAPTI